MWKYCRTLLYELVSGEYPWTGLRPEEIMWLVMNGQRQSLATLGCNSVLKVIAIQVSPFTPFCNYLQQACYAFVT